MMRWAVLAPTPGRVCNCEIVAAFRLTGALGVARALRAAGAFDFDAAAPDGADFPAAADLPVAAGLLPCADAAGTPADAIETTKKAMTNVSRRMLSSRVETDGRPTASDLAK